MATRQAEPELAPGFSILPGGNVMYQVATDYPKQMAQISAQLDALGQSQRLGSLHFTQAQLAEQEKRLRDELTSWENRIFGQQQKPQVVTQPRTTTIGNNWLALNPETGKVDVLFQGETKPTPPRKFTGPTTVDKIGSPTIPASLTLDEWVQIAPSLDPRIATNAPVSAYLEMARNQAQPTNSPIAATAAAPVSPIAVQPQVAPAAPKKSTYRIINYN